MLTYSCAHFEVGAYKNDEGVNIYVLKCLENPVKTLDYAAGIQFGQVFKRTMFFSMWGLQMKNGTTQDRSKFVGPSLKTR